MISGELRWKCRRGMLELDVLLTRFLDQGYAALSTIEQADFERLLAEEDTVLYQWLLHQSTPLDPVFRQLVNAIRLNVRTDN